MLQAVCFSVWRVPDTDAWASAIDVEHDVGPLPLTTELIAQFQAPFSTGGDGPTFYYADNGMELRPWTYNASLTIPGNFKPAIHSSVLRSPSTSPYSAAASATSASLNTADAVDLELAVIVGHTMGSTSRIDGVLELMLHRNLNSSDSQGPWPLRDPARHTVRMGLLVGTRLAVGAVRPQLETAVAHPALVAGAPDVPLDAWMAQGFATHGADWPDSVPLQVTLLNLFARDPQANPPTEYVVRLRHQYEAGAHPTLSQPATVDIAWLLAAFAPLPGSLQETTWTLAELKTRPTWPTQPAERGTDQRVIESTATAVVLTPMEIKTFVWSSAVHPCTSSPAKESCSTNP